MDRTLVVNDRQFKVATKRIRGNTDATRKRGLVYNRAGSLIQLRLIGVGSASARLKISVNRSIRA